MRVGRTVTYTVNPSSGLSRLGTWIARIVLGIFLVAVPVVVISFEVQRVRLASMLLEVKDLIVEAPGDRLDPTLDNQFIHFTASPVFPDEPVRDPDFDLQFNGALAVQRHVEYCQWIETYTESSKRDSSNNQVKVTRTYYYTLGWRPHRIVSLLFDQAAAHHNPQRDPVPARTYRASSAHLGPYTIDSTLLAQLEGDYELFVPDKAARLEMEDSPASTQHGFRYVGGGYHYSAYDESMASKLIRGLGMAAEGTLLDYQLGDLFRTCTPGDIRVHHTVLRPAAVSGLALQGPAGRLQPRPCTRGALVLLRAGTHSADDLQAAALRRGLGGWLLAVLGVVWGGVAAAAAAGGPWWAHGASAAAWAQGAAWTALWGGPAGPVLLALGLAGHALAWWAQGGGRGRGAAAKAA